MQKTNRRKSFRVLGPFLWAIVFLSALLVVGSYLSMYQLIDSELWPGLDKVLTKFTEIFGFAAVFLLLARMVWTRLKKRGGVRSPLVGSLWLFLRKRHEMFGWIVAAAGTAHSIYYLVLIPRDLNGVVSGLIAFAIMAALVLIGYVLTMKDVEMKHTRWLHTVLGILFFVALLYHVGHSH